MDDREAAWDALHTATPAGWQVGRPVYNPGAHRWQLYAWMPSERLRVGHRTNEWTAVGQTEVECVGQMARCLRIIGAGEVPR